MARVRAGLGGVQTAVVADVRVGISGWRYAPWRGVFYPQGLPQRDELSYLGEHLRTVEINGSFYSLQRPSSYLTWASQVPEAFVFAVKGGRFELYVSGYSDEALDRWARRIRGWLGDGLDVHVYFDNDVKVRAPFDAMALADRLGVAPSSGRPDRFGAPRQADPPRGR